MSAQWTALMLAGAVVALALALALAIAAWGGRRDGLRCWAAALVLQALVCAVLGPAGPFASAGVTLGSGLLATLSVACVQAAVQRLQGMALSWPSLAGPVLLLGAALALGPQEHGWAALLTGGVLAGQIAWVLWTLLEQRMQLPGRGAVLMALGLGALMALHAALAVAGLAGLPDAQSVLADPVVLAAGALWALGAWLLASLGFVFVQAYQGQLRSQTRAALDEATGIANRRSIIAALDRDVARAIRTRLPIAVLMLEPDAPIVGAAPPAPEGHALFASLVDLVQNRIRAQDIVGRYGPQALLVVLPDTSVTGALRLAGQLCSAAHTLRALQGDSTYASTISVGVFGARLESGDSWDMLIHAADQALAAARQGGGDQVQAAGPLQRVQRAGLLTPAQETSPTTLT